MVNLADAVFGETAALEAGGVESVGMGVAGGNGFGKRKHVAGDGGAASNEGVGTNADKMVHGTKRAHRGPFFDDYVATQSCGVGQNDVVSDHAVVGNVAVGHDERVTADARDSAALGGAAIQSRELAHDIVVTDFEARRLSFVTDVLRSHPDGSKRKEAVAGADFRRARDGDVRDQLAICAQFNASPDGAIRANFA